MRFAVIGTGAMGAVLGGRLAARGEDVVFLARGRQLAALRRDGLYLQQGDEVLHLDRPAVAADPAEIGPVDAVLLCVKMYDLEAALARLAPLLRADTCLMTLQNGIEAPALAAQAAGGAAVLAAVSWFAARITAPGRIEVAGGMQGRPWLELGAFAGGTSAPAETLARHLAAAGIGTRVVADTATLLWHKFCLISATSSSAALTRLPIGAVRADPDSRWLIEQAVRETAAVARARGAGLASDIEQQIIALIDSMPAAARPSQLTDLEAGKPLELAWLSGAVCRLGAASGVATPYHRTAYAALAPYARGRPERTWRRGGNRETDQLSP